MQISFTGWKAIVLTVLVGCSLGTSGGPGTTDKKPAYGQADNTFNLSVPTTSSSVQQGEKAEAVVGIKRAKNFDEDVTLKFADVPKDVTIEPNSPVIMYGDSDTKIIFSVGDTAPLGDFKVKVTGHSTKGGDAQVDFKLSIAARDTSTLHTPNFSTSLKQGETKAVSIGINRDKSFNQNVSLSFCELPTGVTVKPDAPVIKQRETETQLTFASTEDASLGEFAIKVTGHPSTGPDATNEFKIKVAKQ